MKRLPRIIILLCCISAAGLAHAVLITGTEIFFIDRLTLQRQTVVDMSVLVQKAGNDPEVKAKAAEFARIATREIAEMQQWRTHWYGDRVQPGDERTPRKIEVAPALAALCRAPDAAFDRTYIDQLIAHDREGIAIARGAERDAKHPEMRDLAQQLITQQHREIERLKKLKKTRP